MKRYVIRRLLMAIPLLLAISFVCFVFINLIPSNPAEVVLRIQQTPIITDEAIAEMEEALGLNKPFLVRYFDWVLGCLQGDFGISYVNPARTVAGELARCLPATLQLAAASFVIVLLLSIPIGFLCAVYKDGWFDKIMRGLVFISTAMPAYWVGLLLMWGISVKLGLLPTNGNGTWQHMILPAFTVALSYISTYIRLIRNNMLENMKQDYVLYANVRGLPQRSIWVKHVLKNSMHTCIVAMVHSETTSGILNDIQSVGKVVRDAGRTFIVDAMSSFGGVDIPVSDWGIDFLVSSANKCIQGVPGFSFILCRRDKLLSSEGKARSLSLDLLDQWKGMEKDGKWRFTSPTHVVLAFSKALDELEAEGGIPARHRRYAENNRLLIEKMRAMGFAPYIDGSRQGPIITTFFYPAGVPFQFSEFYTYIKERGYVLYPGKLTDADTFRVGNIGEIYPEDIEKLASIIAGFLAAHKEEIA